MKSCNSGNSNTANTNTRKSKADDQTSTPHKPIRKGGMTDVRDKDAPTNGQHAQAYIELPKR